MVIRNLLIFLLLTGCGVKSAPVRPPGTALPSILNEFKSSPPPQQNLNSSDRNDDEPSAQENKR